VARWFVIVALLALFVPGAGVIIATLLQLAAHAVLQLSTHTCTGHLVTALCRPH
jgi:hypothetical protein